MPALGPVNGVGSGPRNAMSSAVYVRGGTSAVVRCHAPLWLCHFAGITDGWPNGWNQLKQGRRTSGVPIPVGIAYPVFAISVFCLRRSQ